MKVVLCFGSNLGDREQLIQEAVRRMESIGSLLCVSSLYETAPWGFDSPYPFLNQVAIYSSTRAPQLILQKCLETEAILGRERTGKQYASRTMDIDILLYDSLVIETDELILPHPRLHLRNFVLFPLQEVLPDFIHPIYQKTISVLLAESMDTSPCVKK